MCDYSLHNVTSRPAKVGDKLITTQFNGSITRGFAAVDDPNVAVCLAPGTEVVFGEEVRWHVSTFGLLCKSPHVSETVARFRQINKEQPNTHHDALEFPNGETVLLNSLYDGQHATVLQLPASLMMKAKAGAEIEAETQTHVVHLS
jgi:hypothetical protein